jgi:hypothetical protein
MDDADMDQDEGEQEEGEIIDDGNIPMYAEDEEDKEDDQILNTDAIIVTATA